MPTCPGGSRPKATAPTSIYVSEQNARAYAGAAPTWLSTILSRFRTQLILTASLCASEPEQPEPWDISDLLNIASAEVKLNKFVLWHLWNDYCE